MENWLAVGIPDFAFSGHPLDTLIRALGFFGKLALEVHDSPPN
jgi:hypothetical protein